jgi:hypothetical protein
MEERCFDKMSDEGVLARVRSLAARSNELTAELLVYLAELDRRGLYLREACGSLFAFCVERLHMSEAAAGKRITAARTGRRFPIIFEMIARGEIHLTAVTMLAPHLVEENHADLLARARHRRKREIEKLVAEIAPKPDVASRMVALPHRALEESPLSPPVTTAMGTVTSEQGADGERAPERVGSPSTAPRTVVAPLSPRRYLIRVTVGEETHAALEQLQDLPVAPGSGSRSGGHHRACARPASGADAGGEGWRDETAASEETAGGAIAARSGRGPPRCVAAG